MSLLIKKFKEASSGVKTLPPFHELYNQGDVFNGTVTLVEEGVLVSSVQSEEGKKIIFSLLKEGNIDSDGILNSVTRNGAYSKSLSVIAKIPAKVHQISVESFRNIQKTIGLDAVKEIGNLLMSMEERHEDLVFLDSRTRILKTFVNLADRFGQRIGYEILINLPITHQDIANMSATSRQTVTTLCTELKNKNLLYVGSRGKFLIRDLDAVRLMIE